MKETYIEGQFIIKYGDPSECLYIIKEGTVDCLTLDKKVVRTLGTGEHFGAKSLLMQSTRTMSVIAKTKCVVCSISTQSFKLIIGENYKEAILLNIIKNSFSNSKALKNINFNLLESSFGKFEMKNYESNEKIMATGDVIQAKFVIIIEGNIVQVCFKVKLWRVYYITFFFLIS